MSAQINLFEQRFLKRRDPLNLGNVALLAGATFLALAIAGGWAWQGAVARKQATVELDRQVKAARDQVDSLTKAAGRKADPQLVAQAERTELMVRRRGEIARLLESGAIGNSTGFAEFLRGLARQVPEGLWLTGFSIGTGGSDLEIRGKTENAAALPEYIRRLGTEKTFQGRNFAALTMTRPARVMPASATPASAPVTPARAPMPQPIEFVLSPRLAATSDTTTMEGKP